MSQPFAVLVILLAPNVASIGSIRLSEGEICDNRLHEPTPEARLMLVYIFGLRMRSLHKEAQWWSQSVYKAQLCLAAYTPKWCIPVSYADQESSQEIAEKAVYTYAANITQSNGRFGCACEDIDNYRRQTRGLLFCIFEPTPLINATHSLINKNYTSNNGTKDLYHEGLNRTVFWNKTLNL